MAGIGQKLRNLRRARGLTQDELAARLHVTRQALSRWERDDAQPSLEMLQAVALELGTPARELMLPTQSPEEVIMTNEDTYGAEARERWGDDVVDASNRKLEAMSADEWSARSLLEESIKVQLRIAMATGDPQGSEAEELCHLHARWIKMHWPDGRYSPAAHLGLAHGYLCDDRFRSYFVIVKMPRCKEFLVAALESWLA